ncbi:MAG: hypothetical protein SCK70_13765, partial [bacterium]|nr:hypothetical protein [bacterium]
AGFENEVGMIHSIAHYFDIKILPPKRARELMAILLAIVSFAIWLSLQFVRASQFDRSSADFNIDRLENLRVISQSYLINILPSTWAARTLTGLAVADAGVIVFNFLPLLLLMFSLIFLSIRLCRSAFEQGLVNNLDTITLRHKNKTGSSQQVHISTIKTSPLSVALAVMKRDLKLVIRDTRQLTNFIMFAAIMIILPLLQSDSQPDSTFAQFQPYTFVLIIAGLLSTQFASKLIPIEAKSFWITKIAPQSGLRLIWGKFLLAWFFCAIITWIAVILIGFYFNHPLRIRLLALITTLGLSGLFSAAGLVFGIYFAQFDWDHPKRMISSTGGLLLSLSLLAAIALLGGITAVIYLMGATLELSQQFLDILAMVLNIIIITTSIVILNLISARKLENLEWRF